jgi:D-psicose/D-tagatose/L-ribulose 3-epimerase
MKLGMNMLLWTTNVSEEHYPILAKLKEAGFDGVEIPVFEENPTPYEQLRKELDKLALSCTTVFVVPPEASPIDRSVEVRKQAMLKLRRAIKNTAILGGELMCGPYHSPLGVFTGQPPTEDEKKRGAEVMRFAAEEAKKSNVKLAIEYLNRFECYFLTTAAEAHAFVARVGHDNFKMMWDTFHANIEEKDSAKAINAVADSIVHVHVSENDRGTPGTGHVNFMETFKALHHARYDGWLVIEAFGRALPALAAATKVWRDLFPSPEEVFTKGLRYTRVMWEEAQLVR